MATKEDNTKKAYIWVELTGYRKCKHAVSAGYHGWVEDQKALHDSIDGIVKMIEQKYSEPCSLCENQMRQKEKQYFVPGKDNQ